MEHIEELNAVENAPVFSFIGMQKYGICVKVCDGDTIWIKINLGSPWGINKIKCRLWRCDTSEIRLGSATSAISKKLGVRAHEFLSKCILDKPILVEFKHFDLYGRPLVVVFLVNNNYQPHAILNNLLIKNGHAIYWDDSTDKKSNRDKIIIPRAIQKGLLDLEEICDEVIAIYREENISVSKCIVSMVDTALNTPEGESE